MFWGNIGNKINGVIQQAASTVENEVAHAAGNVTEKVSNDPRVKNALDKAGKAVSAPTQKKLTPTIIAVGVGVLVFGAILVWAVTRKRAA